MEKNENKYKLKEYIDDYRLSNYDVIYLYKVNKDVPKVYDIIRCNQLHFQQIMQIYSRKYLKYHNLLDLSTLEYDSLDYNLFHKKIIF